MFEYIKKISMIGMAIVLLLLGMAVPVCAEDDGEETGLTAEEESLAKSFQLTEEMYISLRDELFSAVLQRKETVNLQSYGLPQSGPSLNEILKTNTRYFYVEIDKVSTSNEGKILSVHLSFSLTKNEIISLWEETETMLEGLAESQYPFAYVALIVHDRMISDIALMDDSAEPNGEVTDPASEYSCLVEKKANSAGYAKTYALLMRILGIDTETVYSKELNHWWNIVTLNQKKYHVDVAGDDSVNYIPGLVKHTYFFVSADMLRADGSHRASDVDFSKTGTSYDGEFWTEVDTEIAYINKSIFYINNQKPAAGLYSVDRDGKQAVRVLFMNIGNDTWKGAETAAAQRKSYARLDTVYDYLLYSLNSCVYIYNPVTGKNEKLCAPDTEQSAKQSLYGFSVKGDRFILMYADSSDIFNENTNKTYVSYPYTDVLANYLNPSDKYPETVPSSENDTDGNGTSENIAQTENETELTDTAHDSATLPIIDEFENNSLRGGQIAVLIIGGILILVFLFFAIKMARKRFNY